MTAYIAQSNCRCGTSHTAVIIHALAPVMGPYMSRAITTIHIQEISGTRTSSITAGVRSYRNADSRIVGGCSSRAAGWTIDVSIPENMEFAKSRLNASGVGLAAVSTMVFAHSHAGEPGCLLESLWILRLRRSPGAASRAARRASCSSAPEAWMGPYRRQEGHYANRKCVAHSGRRHGSV